MGSKKKNPDRMMTIIHTIIHQIKSISILLNPIIPDSSKKVLKIINMSEDQIKIDNISNFNCINYDKEINTHDILFNKIEDDN